MAHFPLRNGHQSIPLDYFLKKRRSRVILSKGEYSSQDEDICTFELVQMFGAATNTNIFCTATGGPVLASGEHVTGGLVAAAARGRLYQLFAHCCL